MYGRVYTSSECVCECVHWTCVHVQCVSGCVVDGVTDRLGGMGSGPLRNFVPPLSNVGEMVLYTKK